MDPADRDPERQIAGSLVEERVARLEEITQCRNVLLREMYALIQRRDKLGLLPDTSEGPPETAEDLQEFLDRFDLQKYPETGSVLLGFTEEDLNMQYSRFDEETEEMPMSMDAAPVPVDHVASTMPPPVSPLNDAAPDSNAQARRQSVTLEYPPSETTREPASSPPPQFASEDVEIQENVDMQDVRGLPEDQKEEPTSPVEEMETQGSVSIQLAADVARSQSNLPSPSPSLISLISQRPDVEGDKKSASLPAEVQKKEINAKGQTIEDQEPSVRPQDIMPLPPPTQHLVSPPPMPTIILNIPLRQPSSVIIMSALAPIHDSSEYTFDETQDSAISPPSSATKANIHFHLSRNYSLPPLKSLPAEFQRKSKLAKQQRKREKEKDKGENGLARGDARGREARDDWTPMGINKWGAVMRANPLWRRMSRATKCLSTRDWGVAFEELRFIRTLERVEMAKDTGKWSYRQPKKQRGVGGLMKTHWDHLLDEMKWMRIDFREERKWKILLAFELSTAVLEWHEAGTKEERMRRGLIVDWHKPPVDNESLYDEEMEDAEDEALGAESSQEQGNMLAVDYGSDDSDDDQEQDKQDVVDALEPTQVIEEALDSAEIPTPYGERSQSSNGDLVPKEEDVEEVNMLRPDGDVHNMDVDSQPRSQQQQRQEQQKEEVTDGLESKDSKTTGLKPTSDDPILGGATEARDISTAPRPSGQGKLTSKSNQYVPLRGQIAYSNEHTLFLNVDDFHLRKPDAAPPSESPIEAPHPTDLSTIFPDLQVYGVLDVAPSPDGKKKTEKRDKDYPYKRAEDTTYSKLTPLGRFMREKPTLLGPLEPSKHWKDDHWVAIDDAPVVPDFEVQIKVPDDVLCALFEGSRPLTMMTGDDDSILPGAPRDPLKRVTDSHWTPQDDLLIKRLAEKYPRNWGLISDLFNASRGAISTEKRSDWECKARYKSRWLGERGNGNGNREVPSGSAITPATPARPQPQMTTRKRLASVTSQAAPTPAPPVEPKKRRRHVLMYDTIRKVMKKREAAQKASANPKKPPVVHDTHGQYNKMPKLSPAQLSKMKAEKEMRDQQEALARRRNEELARSHMNVQRLAVQGAAPPVATPTPNGASRPPTVDIPAHQTVPQIRSQVNISQQQRIPTSVPANNAAVAAAARMSPQQILQAQQIAQQRALAAAANANQPAAPGISAPHMSPPYTSRAATSSPAVVPQTSPPRSSATPNPPRPASAQQHVPITQASPTMHQPTIARQTANMAHYFPMTSAQLTPEQMEQALRLQQIMQQQRQVSMQQQQAGGQPGSQYPQS